MVLMAPGERAEGFPPKKGREARWGSRHILSCRAWGLALLRTLGKVGVVVSCLCFSGTVGVAYALEPHSLFFVCLFILLQILSHLIFLRSPIPFPSPPGIRTEQDFYVRLIDSMTKQVSFLISRRGVTLGPRNLGRSRSWLLLRAGSGTRTLNTRADLRPHSQRSLPRADTHTSAHRVGKVARRLLPTKGDSGLVH